MVNKRYLFQTITLLMAFLLIGCQPETAVESNPSPTPLMPQIATVALTTTKTEPPMVETRETEPAATTTPQPGFTAQPEDIPPTDEIADSSDRLVQLAREELAAQSEISVEEVQVLSVEAVVWQDSSLGCPQPGILYALQVIPGYLITLTYQDHEIQYHSDELNTVVTCDGKHLVPVPTPPFDLGAPMDGSPWVPVD